MYINVVYLLLHAILILSDSIFILGTQHYVHTRGASFRICVRICAAEQCNKISQYE